MSEMVEHEDASKLSYYGKRILESAQAEDIADDVALRIAKHCDDSEKIIRDELERRMSRSESTLEKLQKMCFKYVFSMYFLLLLVEGFSGILKLSEGTIDTLGDATTGVQSLAISLVSFAVGKAVAIKENGTTTAAS